MQVGCVPAAGGGSVVKHVRKPVDGAVMDLSDPFPESHRGIVCCICSERWEKLVINTPEAAGGRCCRFSCMAWVSVHGTMSLHGTFMPTSLRCVMGLLTPAVLPLI